MATRLKDSERTKLIAEFIRTGKSPEGYIITINEGSKYKVRRIKSRLEQLQIKKDKLTKQLEAVELELNTILQQNIKDNDNKNIEEHVEEETEHDSSSISCEDA